MSPQQQARQQEILERAHHQYEGALSSYAFFKVNNREKSEDLVQETFLKTWRYIVKGGEIATMKAFLYRILNNLIVDEYRKHKTSSLDMLIEKGFEPIDNEESANSSSRLLDMLDGKAVLALIQELPEKYKNVMSMRYCEGMPIKEISALTGQSKNHVSVQLHRGLEKLKLLYHRVELR